MIKRSDIVWAANITALQTVVAGSTYEDLVNDLLSINVQQPSYPDIQQIVLDSFDKEQAGQVEISQTINSWDSLVLSGVTPSNIVSILADIPNVGAQIPAVATIDPGGVSGNWPNLINGNYSDLCFNNISAGSTNKELPAIDLWSSIAVGKIDLYWWDNNYVATDFNIQASNDWASWTDVVSNLVAPGAGLQQVPVTGTFRYWRMLCNTGIDASFVVLSEMEAFAPGVGTTKVSLLNNQDLLVVDNDPNTTITNNLPQDLVFTINYLV